MEFFKKKKKKNYIILFINHKFIISLKKSLIANLISYLSQITNLVSYNLIQLSQCLSPSFYFVVIMLF